MLFMLNDSRVWIEEKFKEIKTEVPSKFVEPQNGAEDKKVMP